MKLSRKIYSWKATVHTRVMYSQIFKVKVQVDASRIDLHFILFVPLGKRGNKYQMLAIIFRSKTSTARVNRCF